MFWLPEEPVVRATDYDLAEMLRHQEVNYVGALHVLDAVLPPLLAQGQGHISLVASVAGYRGLPQSLAYGPTKAALIHLAEALYLDVSTHGLGVSVVNPGFVETPLTAQNTFHMPALMQPEDAARAMLRGWAQGAFEIHYPQALHALAQADALIALPCVLCVGKACHGLVTTRPHTMSMPGTPANNHP